jgi:hypothetical protein
LTFLPRLHTLNAIAEKQSFGKTQSAKDDKRQETLNAMLFAPSSKLNF